MEVHTTERTRHFLVKKPKKILQLRLEDKNVFNAIHLNSIGYVFEFGPKEVVSTRKHSGSSKNWNAAHRYGTETSGNRWTSGGLTLATQLWEPRSLSLETNDWQQVGPVMEGLAVNGGWAYSSWYRSAAASDQLKGNIVAFNMKKLNKYQAQYLSPRSYLYKKLSFGKFKSYS